MNGMKKGFDCLKVLEARLNQFIRIATTENHLSKPFNLINVYPHITVYKTKFQGFYLKSGVFSVFQMDTHLFLFPEKGQMTMTTATITELPAIYFEDFKPFFRRGCPETRDSLMKQLKEKVHSVGKSFSALFPNRTKRKDIASHILLLASVSGIAVVSGKKLAENVGCSVDYVYKSMPFIKETGEILVTGLADGSNKYVFVLKSHENFQRILKEVFFIHNTEPTPEPSTEPKTPENVDMTASNDENSGVQSFKSFSSKQESNIYIASAIENEISSIKNDEEKEAEQVATYYTNDFQHLLYKTFRNDYSLSPEIRDCMAILGLRLGSNCTYDHYRNAYQAIMKIDGFLKQGGAVREGIPALFSSIYLHGLNMDEYTRVYCQKNVMTPVEPVRKVKRVPFYDWLNERE